MYRIIEGRGTGKTSRLMLLAKENQAIFICSNPQSMEYKAEKYGITGIHFISYEDFYMHQSNYDNCKIVIDELENFLNYTFLRHQHLLSYTISQED